MSVLCGLGKKSSLLHPPCDPPWLNDRRASWLSIALRKYDDKKENIAQEKMKVASFQEMKPRLKDVKAIVLKKISLR